MAISFPSVCVPRVTMHSDSSDVERVFNSIFGGDYVERVDVRETTDSKGLQFQVMFVHFKQDLPANKWTELFYQKLQKDTMVKVMTGFKEFYWKVYYNQSSKKAPHIMTSDEEAKLASKVATETEVNKAAEAAEAAEVAEAAEEVTEPKEVDVILSTVD